MHVYIYVFFFSLQCIRISLAKVASNVEMQRVCLVVPRKWMLWALFVLSKSVAFAKRSPNK